MRGFTTHGTRPARPAHAEERPVLGNDSVLIAHPSADRYGSDLQLLETVSALTGAGSPVTVVLPVDGPLVELLSERGATVRLLPFPVLRKSAMRPAGFVVLIGQLVRRLPGLIAAVRSSGAGVVLVNTVTIPWWLLAARITGRRAICHVHEAEDSGPRLALRMLGLPILLAHRIVVNSHASARTLTDFTPRARDRVQVVYNGVPGPPGPVSASGRDDPDQPLRVVLVGRLSERKGSDVALDAVAQLRSAGRDVRLVLCGTAFEGYEWFERQLRERAAAADLSGAVEFRGYVSPTWSALAEADVVIVPSRVEPFGNTAVEALLAERPLVASRTQGLAEIIDDARTGLQVPPGDAGALASAIATLADDPALARTLAAAGRADAEQRFSVAGYVTAMRRTVSA